MSILRSDHSLEIKDRTTLVAQQKLLRVFRLIRMLSQSPGRTIDDLSLSLEITRRSVYRYLELLESIGYLLDKDMNGRYFLFTPFSEELPNQFTPEETDLLRQLIQSGATDNVLQDGLLRKLYLNTDLLPIADQIHNAHAGRVVRLLSEAINDRFQAKLIRYYSASRGQTSDRLVEPLHLTDNFRMLAAYEVESGQVKHFKIDRIQDVELQDTPQKQKLTVSGPDLFGMSGEVEYSVSLRLSPLAFRLMVEEYPATKPLITPVSGNFPFQFKGEVKSLVGVGRFILGLPREVQVEGPKELVDYLEDQIAQRQWNEGS